MHVILIIGVFFVSILGVGYIILQNNQPTNTVPKGYTQNDSDYQSCELDSDCVIAINPEGCCYCPDSINKKYLGQDNWEKYERGKTYTSDVECDLLCEQCAIPGEPVCLKNKCSFKSQEKIDENVKFLENRKVIDQSLPDNVLRNCESDSDCENIISHNTCTLYCANSDDINQNLIDPPYTTCDATLWDPPFEQNCGCVNDKCELYE